MLQIPAKLLKEIQEAIRSKSLRGEKGWNHAERDEDTLVGDFLGNLRSDRERSVIDNDLYEWEIIYKKFQGRGYGAYESDSGADAIITYEISDLKTDIKTVKSIIFQAKKGTSTQNLSEQKRKMAKIAKDGNFVFICTSDGYFAQQDDGPRMRIGDFLADIFLPCKTGIEGMLYDPIRRELRFDAQSLLHYNVDHRLIIDVKNF